MFCSCNRIAITSNICAAMQCHKQQAHRVDCRPDMARQINPVAGRRQY
jgi:hypothetical protein